MPHTRCLYINTPDVLFQTSALAPQLCQAACKYLTPPHPLHTRGQEDDNPLVVGRGVSVCVCVCVCIQQRVTLYVFGR